MSDPVAMPKLAATPAFGPLLSPWPSTYIMSLPGVRLRASAAVRKTARSERSIGIEHLPERKEIAPGKALLCRLAQEIGRVKCCEQRHLGVAQVIVEPFPA